MTAIEEKVEEIMGERHEAELALGYLRYEALRKLNVTQFRELYMWNIVNRVNFDDLVDQLVMKG